jgi:hypothetical protein
MGPEEILFWSLFAVKVGREAYVEIRDMLAGKLVIPTWDELKSQGIQIDDLIAQAEKL